MSCGWQMTDKRLLTVTYLCYIVKVIRDSERVVKLAGMASCGAARAASLICNMGGNYQL